MSAVVAKRAFGVNDLAEFAARIDELRAEDDPPTVAGDYLAYTDGACLGNPEGPGGWAAVVDVANRSTNSVPIVAQTGD